MGTSENDFFTQLSAAFQRFADALKLFVERLEKEMDGLNLFAEGLAKQMDELGPFRERLAKQMVGLKPFAEGLQKQMDELNLFAERLDEQMDGLEPFPERLAKQMDELVRYGRAFIEWALTGEAFKAVGWLPYHTTPFHYVKECGDDLVLLDKRLDDFYRTRWSEIRDDLELRLNDYLIDDEAKETYREALSAHAAGYYRCVCCVLFPEIERVIGLGRVRKKEIEKLTSTGTLADFVSGEPFAIDLFGYFVDHMYESVKGNRAKLAQMPVPNRHAALHGLIPYSTHKESMNMLIMTDYIFQTFPTMNGSET